jgi:hypothetical protein
VLLFAGADGKTPAGGAAAATTADGQPGHQAKKSSLAFADKLAAITTTMHIGSHEEHSARHYDPFEAPSDVFFGVGPTAQQNVMGRRGKK